MPRRTPPPLVRPTDADLALARELHRHERAARPKRETWNQARAAIRKRAERIALERHERAVQLFGHSE